MTSDAMRERLERLFRYGQVGQCVSSVTHDVNNYLGAILAYSDLIQLAGDLPGETRRMLSQIGDAVQKCSVLINHLTAIARREKPNAGLSDIGPIIESVIDLRRYDFRVGRVTLDTAISDQLPSIVVDPPRLEMAIIYLLSNAFEAVQDSESARVSLRACDDGGAVEITVWNSGPPVPESDRDRIFEPFYTTKGDFHVGLGLTLARDIARLHDGEVAYDPDRGFTMRLPHVNRLSQL